VLLLLIKDEYFNRKVVFGTDGHIHNFIIKYIQQVYNEKRSDAEKGLSIDLEHNTWYFKSSTLGINGIYEEIDMIA